jgi:hypothetical protein
MNPLDRLPRREAGIIYGEPTIRALNLDADVYPRNAAMARGSGQ